MLRKLTQFYDNFILPEIVYPSVKFGLPATDIFNFNGYVMIHLYLKVITCTLKSGIV